jgi:hypothetical protein
MSCSEEEVIEDIKEAEQAELTVPAISGMFLPPVRLELQKASIPHFLKSNSMYYSL